MCVSWGKLSYDGVWAMGSRGKLMSSNALRMPLQVAAFNSDISNWGQVVFVRRMLGRWGQSSWQLLDGFVLNFGPFMVSLRFGLFVASVQTPPAKTVLNGKRLFSAATVP